MTKQELIEDAVLRIGEVSGVDGRRIDVLVDTNKNLSDMFFDGDILRNISVNSFIEIRKGFISIIGRVEGERIQEDFVPARDEADLGRREKRVLTVSLAGYIDETGRFFGGTRELPLIGNEAYIVTRAKLHAVHNLVGAGKLSVSIATSEDFSVDFPVDGLFNSHMAIFGNTGSGKSNTLASLYQSLFALLNARNQPAFLANTRFVFFDFNGEYGGEHCLTNAKTVYNLSTRDDAGDKIPLPEDALLDLEVLSILADATEKTQKPFLGRALRQMKHIEENVDDAQQYVRGIMRNLVNLTLRMADKSRAFLVIEQFRDLLPKEDEQGNAIDLQGDIDWHNQSSQFMVRGSNPAIYLPQRTDHIPNTRLFQHVQNFTLPESLVSRLVLFLTLQLISDILVNRAQFEHVAPVIGRLKAKRHNIDRLFDYAEGASFWESNVVVVNLDDVSLDMKKTIPLLLVKRLYADHKRLGPNRTMNVVVDEAHNILSSSSFREAEGWKDYRLETFEEVIKEGRKFGVFLTIASQRPGDISPTVISQAHNYFIHRLINEEDLRAISSAVSYIDSVTEESIPTLPTGTCIFSGVASQMPMKVSVKPLESNFRPRSNTREFSRVVPPNLL
jgi:uncharacterized protein